MDAGAIGFDHGSPVCNCPPGYIVIVAIVAADTLVDIEELCRADETRIERGQTVLDTDVVEDPQCEACGRIDAVNVLGYIPNGRTRSLCVPDRVIAHILGNQPIPGR